MIQRAFSNILERYLRIELSPSDKALVDAYFGGACHHYWRWTQGYESGGQPEFHIQRFWAHMRHLMEIVSSRGDFSFAVDRSGLALDKRESWDPSQTEMPYPTMFEGLYADPEYGYGQEHPFDLCLQDLRRPVMGGTVRQRAAQLGVC